MEFYMSAMLFGVVLSGLLFALFRDREIVFIVLVTCLIMAMCSHFLSSVFPQFMM